MALLEKEFAEPSDTLVTHFETQIYRGAETSPVRDAFKRATRKAMRQFLSQRVNARLKLAPSRDEVEQAPSEQVVGPAPDSGTNQPEGGPRGRNVVEYTLFGNHYSTRTAIEAYYAIFRAFIESDPKFADRAIPLLSGPRNRRLAKRREELSASASMLRGARELPGGYWLMANLLNSEKLEALQTACKAAGVPFNDPEGLQIRMPNADSSPEQAAVSSFDKGTKEAEPGTRGRKVEYSLFGRQYSTRTAKEAFVAVFRALIERDATFADRVLPLLVGPRNRVLAKRRGALSANAEMLKSAVELPRGYWLLCHLPNTQKLKALQTACETAGVPFNDSEGLQIQMPNVDSP